MTEQEKCGETLVTRATAEATLKPAKTKLDAGEFAIEIGATFDFKEDGTIVKVDSKGNIAITLNFTLNKCETCTIRTTGDISDFNSAIFIDGKDNSMQVSDISSVSTLTLSPDRDRLSFKTDGNDVFLTTDATKGRQGGS